MANRIVLPGRDFVPCGALFRAWGALSYHAAQRVLERNGWFYSIGLDGWIPRHIAEELPNVVVMKWSDQRG